MFVIDTALSSSFALPILATTLGPLDGTTSFSMVVSHTHPAFLFTNRLNNACTTS
jgi:hypothetical protein